MKNKLIFVFLDGIGIRNEDKYNPFARASLPVLSALLGGKLVDGVEKRRSDLLVKGIDACLGVPGVPQSATGQAALFTGFNAPKSLGYHLPAYPNDDLIKLINERSIFKYASEQNLKSIFANSYTDGYFKAFNPNADNYSVTTRCVLAAQSRFNTIDDLIQGRAVHWDITNFSLQNTPENRAPVFTPFQAGKNLLHLASDYDLVLYECFLPDLIGHRKDMEKSLWFLKTLDDFLKGLTEKKPGNVNILISSDHGNMEDLSTGGHTKNPVPLICMGNLAPGFSNVEAIDQIFHTIFQNLQVA
jgi:2,3-bisphosphoglycerate-independent phosphoglycerate mutase